MYTHQGQDIFVIDGHTHLWRSPANRRNKYGEGWIKCFYASQWSESGRSHLPFEKFCQRARRHWSTICSSKATST